MYIRIIRHHHERLIKQYFSAEGTRGRFPDKYFRRRFRMDRPLFLRILDDIKVYDSYFEQKADATGRLSISSHLKMAISIRQMAYGVPSDMLDDQYGIAESTGRECLARFCNAIIEIYGDEYLRSPNKDDIERLLEENTARGFPGMLGSLDCMHWEWKNCPTSWHGMFKGKEKVPTIVLEAVASKDRWIWHAFFGLPGSLNDINIIDRPDLFKKLAQGIAPDVSFTVNGNNYDMGYYLADGIYPRYATLIKAHAAPSNGKESNFAANLDAVRKDVECAFGILQQRFNIVATPAMGWDKVRLRDIMIACIIIHNMIIEYQRTNGVEVDSIHNIRQEPFHYAALTEEQGGLPQRMRAKWMKIMDRSTNLQLQDDLVEHQWMLKGQALNQ